MTYEKIAAEVLRRNSKRAGEIVDWRATKIGNTAGARDSNPWKQLGLEAKKSRDLLDDLVRAYEQDLRKRKRSESEGRSYARDAAMDDRTRTRLGYFRSLQFYLGNLEGAEPEPKVWRPLVEGAFGGNICTQV